MTTQINYKQVEIVEKITIACAHTNGDTAVFDEFDDVDCLLTVNDGSSDAQLRLTKDDARELIWGLNMAFNLGYDLD